MTRAVKVKKRKQPERRPSDTTSVAVAIATLVAFAAIQAAEIIYGNIRNTDAPNDQDIPMWRAHMGSAFAGSVAFIIALFWLESLGRKSKATALRSIFPWLPVVALTGLATAVHIPIYIVLLITASYSVWAYRRTRAVR